MCNPSLLLSLLSGKVKRNYTVYKRTIHVNKTDHGMERHRSFCSLFICLQNVSSTFQNGKFFWVYCVFSHSKCTLYRPVVRTECTSHCSSMHAITKSPSPHAILYHCVHTSTACPTAYLMYLRNSGTTDHTFCT